MKWNYLNIFNCCTSNRNSNKSIDERTRLINDGNDNPSNTPNISDFSYNVNDNDNGIQRNVHDDNSLNDIVQRASDNMINISDQNRLNNSNSIHSLKDFIHYSGNDQHNHQDSDTLNNLLQGDSIKFDKPSDFEISIVKDTALKFSDVFENAFDVSLSQSGSSNTSLNKTSSSSSSSSKSNSDQYSMHEEFENTPKQTITVNQRTNL